MRGSTLIAAALLRPLFILFCFSNVKRFHRRRVLSAFQPKGKLSGNPLCNPTCLYAYYCNPFSAVCQLFFTLFNKKQLCFHNIFSKRTSFPLPLFQNNIPVPRRPIKFLPRTIQRPSINSAIRDDNPHRTLSRP